jgi:hypothetical protein
VFFTIALHAQKNSFQGQSQPHENHSPHRGVTKPAAMAQVPTIDALFGSLTRAPLSDQNGGAPLILSSAHERMSNGSNPAMERAALDQCHAFSRLRRNGG